MIQFVIRPIFETYSVNINKHKHSKFIMSTFIQISWNERKINRSRSHPVYLFIIIGEVIAETVFSYNSITLVQSIHPSSIFDVLKII